MYSTDWRTVESKVIFPTCRESWLNLRGHLLSDDFQEFLNLSVALQGKKYDCPKHSAIALSAGWRLHFHSRTFLPEQPMYLSMASSQIYPVVALLRSHLCSGEYSSGFNFSVLIWSQTATIAFFKCLKCVFTMLHATWKSGCSLYSLFFPLPSHGCQESQIQLHL